MKGLAALADMTLKRPIDKDDASFACLSLPEGKVFLFQDILPRKGQKVRYTQSEEASTANHQAHPIFPSS